MSFISFFSINPLFACIPEFCFNILLVSVSAIRDSKDLNNTFNNSVARDSGFLSNGGSNVTTNNILESSRSIGNGRITANSTYPNGSINSPKNVNLAKQVIGITFTKYRYSEFFLSFKVG